MSKRIHVKFPRNAQDRIKLEPFVNRVLEAIGKPEAFVTDKSVVEHFMFEVRIDESGNEKVFKKGKEFIDEVSDKLGVDVAESDYIWEVAERLRK